MDLDLSGSLDGISERFVPDQDRGRLIEVEHLSRYMWAAGAAPRRRVLDAGCGSGYGCRLLAEGGAASVTGVDIAASVLESIAPTMPDTVELVVGDLRTLDFDDDRFDLITCFEVIEHFDDPFAVLDELVRVLAPGGVLLVSSPNRGVYQAGNPHHLHEFQPEELRSALLERLTHVSLVRQGDYIVSALLTDDAFTAHGGTGVDNLPLRKLVPATPGEETYTIALASNAALPDLGQIALMTGMLEMREWISVFDTQTAAIDDKDMHIAGLEARLADAERLTPQLLDAEQRLATIADLTQRIADLEHALRAAQESAAEAGHQISSLDERLMSSERVLVDVLSSPSWQVTKPLRAAKRLLKQ